MQSMRCWPGRRSERKLCSLPSTQVRSERIPGPSPWSRMVPSRTLRTLTSCSSPGGPATRSLVSDEELLVWIRRAHETSRWTTSVCTGALLLGAAGVLRGLEATTHWLALDELARFGARPVQRRVVEQGKVITSAGVSAGIDMALVLAARLAGDKVAQRIQLAIEYDPQPPFDTGSPQRAPSEMVYLVRQRAQAAIEAAARQRLPG